MKNSLTDRSIVLEKAAFFRQLHYATDLSYRKFSRLLTSEHTSIFLHEMKQFVVEPGIQGLAISLTR